ncbi:MAG: Hsp33 family molecular chaperone HslO [Mycoplasmataceae bacterium]|nr:Hsp33 family molecular chaperone HslO [Mycoplasmataceae bacterium]
MIKSYTKIIVKNNVRIYISDYQKVAQEILTIHKYTPLASLILANGIATFGPVGFLYDIKKVSFLMKTNGAIKTFLLEFQNNNIRALLGDGSVITEYDENGMFNDIPLILGIGDEGLLRVSRFVESFPYTSEVPIANGDMITDLVYYLNKSDQVFSAVINDIQLNKKNHLKVDKAKSIIFQLMPNHNEADILWIEKLIENNDFKNLDLIEYINLIDGEELKHQEVISKCNCTSKKMLDAIKLLSPKEHNNLFLKNENIEIKCDFCKKTVSMNIKDYN